jgi:chemotaxis protein CheX
LTPSRWQDTIDPGCEISQQIVTRKTISRAPSMPTQMIVEHINPFITATMATFQSMLHASVVPGKLFVVKGAILQHDISGIIGLSGGAKGMVALSFPRLTALKAVSSFLGEKVVTMDATVKDAIGELANIVAGAAKKDLSGYKISISLPTVVVGDRHEVQGGKDVIPLAVPFDSPLGSFSLIVSFKSEA